MNGIAKFKTSEGIKMEDLKVETIVATKDAEDTDYVAEPVSEKGINIKIELKGPDFWEVLLAGFKASHFANFLMSCVEITGVHDSGNCWTLSITMRVDGMKSAVTIQMEESQFLELIKLGLKTVSGIDIYRLGLINKYTYLSEYHFDAIVRRVV